MIERDLEYRFTSNTLDLSNLSDGGLKLGDGLLLCGGGSWVRHALRRLPGCEFGQCADLNRSADGKRGSLVQSLRWEVENAFCGRACYGYRYSLATCLLHQHGQGIGFVQQTELAGGSLGRGRIQEDATLEQRTVKVCDE
jgi:hypothetical protein